MKSEEYAEMKKQMVAKINMRLEEKRKLDKDAVLDNADKQALEEELIRMLDDKNIIETNARYTCRNWLRSFLS